MQSVNYNKNKENHHFLVIFDFDHTLVSCDSFIRIAFMAHGRRRTLLALARVLPSLVFGRLAGQGGSKAKERMFRILFGGMDHDCFLHLGRRLLPRLREAECREVVERMHRHIAAGDRVVIASASMPQWIIPWATLHGVHEVIGTEPGLSDAGKLTGHFSTPNCRGSEKLRRLREHISPEETAPMTAYGNLPDDRPLLEASSRGYIVRGGRIRGLLS